ncbi:MAG TPA: aldehyde dehydrogenase family protein, partial [Oceanospirillales bacterium]|nr:aldehyde dehydrogenase family protein [Oceanospirillales bacterium]
LTLDIRKIRLKELKAVIKNKTAEIIQALNKDYGRRCEQETQIAEIMIVLDEIKHTLKHIDAWVKPRTKASNYKFLFSKSAIIPQSLGVVGIIAPWNYPFNLAIAPFVAAIAAGNKVMLKPSEVTPNTSQIIADILQEVFLESEVAVSLGDLSVAQEFSSLPFKHILFTGSTAVGKIIMQAAACHLTPVTLELGGKSPVIIDENYSVKTAAASIVGGKFYNAGQTCIAPDYILVNKKQQQALVEAIKTEINRCFADALNNPDYTAIINQRHFQRLQNLAQECEEKEQCLWVQGKEFDEKLNIFPPLLVLNPSADSKIMQEEIFGPILPIIAVENVDEALNFVNQRANPLTLYVFSNNTKFIKKVLNNTLSGSAAVNETLVQFAQDGLPFGGIGESGTGSYHGKNGFDSFSHLKSVYYQSRLNFNSFARAPYTKFKKKIVKLMSSM